MSDISDELIECSGEVIGQICSTGTHTNMVFDRPFFDAKFVDLKFDKCTFEKIDIKNVSFSGCVFNGCKFKNVNIQEGLFDNCQITAGIFSKSTLDVHFNRSKLTTTQFISCNQNPLAPTDIISKNRGSLHRLRGGPREVKSDINFDEVQFFIVDFNDVNLKYAIFDRCQFDNVEFYNRTKLDFAKFENVIKKFAIKFRCEERVRLSYYDETINNFKVSLDEHTKFPEYKEIKFLVKNRDDNHDFFGLLKSYEEIYSYYNSNDFDANLVGDYYYIYKSLLYFTLEGRARLFSIFIKMLNGYGEKWHRGLFWSLGTIFIFGIIYLTGLQVSGPGLSHIHTIRYELLSIFMGKENLVELISDYGYCLYFSMMTFTTVGYGNMQAIGFASSFFSFVQMFFGGLLMTVTAGTLLRRIVR